jgi:hypothetical protein
MSETTGNSPIPDDDAPRRQASGRRWVLIAALSTATVLLAAGMAVFAASRDDDSPPAARGQMAAAHEAFEQWHDGDAMSGMMPGPMGGDHMMSGPGMGAGPDAMGGTGMGTMGGGESGWCDRMDAWMSQHRGDGGDSDG